MLAKADAIVSSDRCRYDSLWARRFSTAAEAPGLARLGRAVESCRAAARTGVAGDTEARLKRTSAAGKTAKPRQLISDPAVLFAQAAALNPRFQDCVAEWAQGVAGAAPKRVGLKRRARAVEKLFRSYGGDASNLVDLVRSAITFGSVGGLVEVLERIRGDPRVVILQVKNRLDPRFDSRESAGYRNVALSVAIVDHGTMASGLDAHVCELQLSLAEIDEIRNDDGHLRYVKWRDLLAE